jgi:hypothetical protein
VALWVHPIMAIDEKAENKGKMKHFPQEQGKSTCFISLDRTSLLVLDSPIPLI